jgi:hypothetical protein
MSDDRAIPPAVCAVWERLADRWDDTARHEAFVALVAQHGCYAWAAARYRERAGDPIAEAQLARLRSAAVDQLIPEARARRKRRRIGIIGLLGVLIGTLFAVLVIGFLYLSSCGAG